MTDKPELLPCPFCGGTELYMDMVGAKNIDGNEPSIVIECPTKNCAYGQFSRGHKLVAGDAEVATKLWNTRAPLGVTKAEAAVTPDAAKLALYYYKRGFNTTNTQETITRLLEAAAQQQE